MPRFGRPLPFGPCARGTCFRVSSLKAGTLLAGDRRCLNEETRRGPKKSRITERNKFSSARCFCSGRIVRQTRDEFHPFNPKESRGFESPSLRHTVCRCCLQFWRSAKTPRGRRGSLRRWRTGEGGLTPDSPASAGILTARNKNGSLRRSGQDFRLGIAPLLRPGISIGQL